MNTRISFTRIATVAALAGCTFVAVHTPRAQAGEMDSMSIDGRAPLSATLLPQVTITASMKNPAADPLLSVADAKPLPVTLLPTVRVSARAAANMTTLLPVVRVFAQAPAASSEEARMVSTDDTVLLPSIEVDADSATTVRGRVMPR
jgi:hypothetical protein